MSDYVDTHSNSVYLMTNLDVFQAQSSCDTYQPRQSSLQDSDTYQPRQTSLQDSDTYFDHVLVLDCIAGEYISSVLAKY